MKKIYLLLAAVMMTLSSFAAPKFASSEMNLQLKDGALEQMQQAKFDFDQKIKEGKVEPMRSWTDKDGVVWNAAMLNNGPAWELFVLQDGSHPEPAQLPLYIVSLRVYTQDQNHEYNIELGWGAKAVFYETIDEAIAALGDEAFDITPIEQVLDFTFEYLSADEGIPYLGIMDSSWLGSTSVYNGEDGYVTGSDMTLTFTEYDKDLNWLDFSLIGSLESNVKKYITINYSGDAAIYGMTDATSYFDPGQVHIFNTGVMDYDTSEWAYVYITEFDPVTRYYLMFTANGYGYSDENGMPLELTYEDGTVAGTNFSATELPRTIPYQIAQDADAFFCGYGALFASEDSQKPYGVWTLPKGYEYDEDYTVLNQALPYELLLGAYTHAVSQQDGMHVVDQNYYYRNPQVGQTEFVIGDVNEGLRFTYVDSFGCNCLIQYKGDIFFHNNPEDYTKVEPLPAVGDENLVSVEKVETEKINVKVVGNSIVAPEGAEIYNLNGVRVNANDLENGLYIVKVGKNAVKVVL